MISRDSRNLKKLKTARRAQFRLNQAFDRIDWEEDVLLPEIENWMGLAQLPAPPTNLTIDVEVIEEDE